MAFYIPGMGWHEINYSHPGVQEIHREIMAEKYALLEKAFSKLDSPFVNLDPRGMNHDLFMSNCKENLD